MKRRLLVVTLIFLSIGFLGIGTQFPVVGQGSTATPPPTAITRDALQTVTIDYLSARTYGDGELKIVSTMGSTAQFTRYQIAYPSDGLLIYGFMNVPKETTTFKALFPVIIAIHGYIDPAVYNTLDYTTRYADALARAGYVVIHPNLRGYRPSQNGPNLFRVGFAADILNLIALVKSGAGTKGALQQADASRLGMWGHSMGGGVSVRVLTLNKDIRASVLYGAMSGDEQQNYAKIGEWSNGKRGKEERAVPVDALTRISPIFYLDRITAAVSIHHGAIDSTVPPAWSTDLYARLQTLNKAVEYFSYPGQDHTFSGTRDQLFIQRVTAFYDRILKTKTYSTFQGG